MLTRGRPPVGTLGPRRAGTIGGSGQHGPSRPTPVRGVWSDDGRAAFPESAGELAAFAVCQGTLVGLRARLIAAGADRRLLERTVELYARQAGARAAAGRVGLQPVVGAGRVEDTINLLGHALRKVVGVLVRQQGRGLTELPTVAEQVGVPIVAGSSLKAALDLDWDDPGARDQALGLVLAAVAHLETDEDWDATA